MRGVDRQPDFRPRPPTVRVYAIPPYPAAWRRAAYLVAAILAILFLLMAARTSRAEDAEESDLRNGSSTAVECPTPSDRADSSRLSYAAALRVRSSVLESMRRRLGLEIRHPVALRLSSKRSMEVRGSDTGLAAVRSGAIGKFRNDDGRYEVFLVDHVSERRAARILAHELAHAYYEENFSRFRARLYREGFSEWVAFHVLHDLGYPRDAERILRRTDIYGDGLRQMLAAEREGGVSRVIETAMH